VNVLLGSVVILILSGLFSLALGKSYSRSTAFGAGGTVLACAIGLYPAVTCLLSGRILSVHCPWNLPFGSFYVEADPLSALFLLPILVVSALSAIYGSRYMEAEKDTGAIGPHWFFFNLLVAGMIMVVLSKNGLLFLISWEVMSLAPFFLVIFDDHKKSTRNAAWTYLVAAHLGGVFLVVLFVLMGINAGTMDFCHFVTSSSVISANISANLLFLLAVIGFGAKAGFIPLHVWLPEAHPAAPSHVSALMSGVMIKMGIYGLLRMITLLGPPPVWWGYLMIGIGLTSGILGVLFALAQHDLKRLLAYHSVENIGIIALGIGVGLVGLSTGSTLLAVLGFAGGLLHVINHSLFKGLLFLGAGSVLHSTHTMEIDHLGGLMKKMPWTGALFLTGAVAICVLPPLNGFVSEFLIYFGSFKGMTTMTSSVPAGALICAIAGLAMIGGLASACFTKAFGIIFLGEPRSEHAENVHESSRIMWIPMLVMAALCVLIGLSGPWVVAAMALAVKTAGSFPSHVVEDMLTRALDPMTLIVYIAFAFLLLTVLILIVRKLLLPFNKISRICTWGCGFSAPSPRMQYTSSSFAQPLTKIFSVFLMTRTKVIAPEGLFPTEASFSTDTPDIFRRFFYKPVFSLVARLLSFLQWLQHGRVQLYILYIVVTVFIIFIWKLV